MSVYWNPKIDIKTKNPCSESEHVKLSQTDLNNSNLKAAQRGYRPDFVKTFQVQCIDKVEPKTAKAMEPKTMSVDYKTINEEKEKYRFGYQMASVPEANNAHLLKGFADPNKVSITRGVLPFQGSWGIRGYEKEKYLNRTYMN